MNPEIFKKAVPLQQQPQIIPNANISSIPVTSQTAAPIAVTNVRPEDYFEIEKLVAQNITLQEGNLSKAVFRHAELQDYVDPFYLVTFLIKENDKTIGTVSRIIPTEEMSAGRLLSLVRKKLFSSISPDDSSLITLSESLNTRGEANFYLNDAKNFPNMIFLVTRSGTKVLALQFSREYNDRVAQILPLFFQ